MNGRQTRVAIAVAAVSLILKCLLAWNTLGTNDMLTWENFACVAASLGPAHLYDGPVSEPFSYATTFGPIFNHPPLVALTLKQLFSLARATGIPFRTLLRIIASLADAGVLLFVSLAVLRGHLRTLPPNIYALAACPVAIMIAGFHGNTDAVMVFFLVLSFYALECWRSVLLCGLFLGLASEIKATPLLLAPALILFLSTRRDRAICIAGFLLAAIPPLIPFTGSIPRVLKNVLGYASTSGNWGSTWLWTALHLPALHWFTRLERLCLIAVIMAASVWMNTGRRRVPLYAQWGVLLFLFMFLTPGFGVQYLIWLVPWVVILPSAVALTHYVLSSLFLFIVYTYWSGGLPWYFANAYRGYWHGWMHIFQVLVWLSSLLVLWSFWRIFVRVPAPLAASDAAGDTGSLS